MHLQQKLAFHLGTPYMCIKSYSLTYILEQKILRFEKIDCNLKKVFTVQTYVRNCLTSSNKNINKDN